MSEVLAADMRISSLLKPDAELAAALGGEVRLHADVAPEGQSNGMWLVFRLVDGSDVLGLGGQPIFAKPSYNVMVCGRDTGYIALRPAIERVKFLLTQGPAVVDGVWVGRFVKRGVVRGVDVTKNLRVFWYGQLFHSVAYDV